MRQGNLYGEGLAAVLVIVIVCVLLFAILNSYRLTSATVLSNSGLITSGDTTLFSIMENSVEWGELAPDETKSINVTLIEEKSNVEYYVEAMNWNPANASDYFTLNGVKKADKLELTLHVHPDIEGIEKFTFDINVVGSKE